MNEDDKDTVLRKWGAAVCPACGSVFNVGEWAETGNPISLDLACDCPEADFGSANITDEGRLVLCWNLPVPQWRRGLRLVSKGE